MNESNQARPGVVVMSGITASGVATAGRRSLLATLRADLREAHRAVSDAHPRHGLLVRYSLDPRLPQTQGHHDARRALIHAIRMRAHNLAMPWINVAAGILPPGEIAQFEASDVDPLGTRQAETEEEAAAPAPGAGV